MPSVTSKYIPIGEPERSGELTLKFKALAASALEMPDLNCFVVVLGEELLKAAS